MPEKKTKVKLGLNNLAMLPSYFGYTFVHLRQNARLRSELSQKFLSTLGPNPTRKAQPDLQLCFLQFVCINNFGAITSRCYFHEELLASRKHLFLSATKLPNLSHLFIFRCKSITQKLRNFFEICRGGSSIMRVVDSLLFFICQNDIVHKSEKLQL